MPTKTQAIVLAAGKGTRMNEGRNSSIPKVMFELAGKPMIAYSVENLKKAGFARPVVVVGFQGQKVIDYLKNKAYYAWQKKRLGTAHAVKSAKDVAKDAKTILVISGDDSAFYRPETLKNLMAKHLENHAAMTLLTIKVSDPTGLGRIIKNKTGQVKEIIEEKLASPEIKEIKEINTSCYVFDAKFLWSALAKVKKNPTGEYFLTDLVTIANQMGEKVISLTAPPHQWHGVNTPEQLEAAREHMKKERSYRKSENC